MSSAGRRWLPLLVIWGQVLLSAWVYAERLPENAQAWSLTLLGVMLGVPAVSFVLWLLSSLVARKDDDDSRSGDLVIVWGLVFMFGLHAAVLAVATRLLSSLHDAIPFGVGALLAGLGVVFVTLEPGSAMGIRTKATLQSREAWMRAHRVAAALLLSGAVMSASSWFLKGPSRLVMVIVPAVAAVLLAILYASRIQPRVVSEGGTEPDSNLRADSESAPVTPEESNSEPS